MDASTEVAKQGLHVIDPRIRVGHLHLVVADPEREIAFYRDALQRPLKMSCSSG